MSADKIIQPGVEIFGILVQEPITTLTDIILAITCFYAYQKLRKTGLTIKTILYLKLYFGGMGIATFLGGVLGHGFLYLLGPEWKIPGWSFSMLSIMFIERSSIEYTKSVFKPVVFKTMLIFNILKLIILMFMAVRSLNFLYAGIQIVSGFGVIVFSCHLYSYILFKDKGSKYVLFSIGALCIAMFIFGYPIVLHTWFNHQDFSHILMTISTLLLLKGALKLERIK